MALSDSLVPLPASSATGGSGGSVTSDAGRTGSLRRGPSRAWVETMRRADAF